MSTTTEMGKWNITHGNSMPGSLHYKEYRAWQTIRNKCLNPNYIKFRYWGGRGIQMCDRWQESFENFLEDVGPCPSPLHTADRYPNNNGHYEPGNFRWATMKQQSNNRRSTHMVEYGGETRSVTQWEEYLGLPGGILSKRLFKRGWEIGKALTTPSMAIK